VSGVRVDWDLYYGGEKRHKVILPTYPFERQRYWIEWNPEKSNENEANSPAASERKSEIADWFYVPSWRRSALPDGGPQPQMRGLNALVFLDEPGIGRELSRSLSHAGCDVVEVQAGESFVWELDSRYRIRPNSQDDYDTLLNDLAARNQIPQLICHLLTVTSGESNDGELQKCGLDSLLCLARALENHPHARVQIHVVSNGLREVRGDETLNPDKALVVGPCKVIPQEYANVDCRSIDIELSDGPNDAERLATLVFKELSANASESAVAWRGVHRWVETVEPMRLVGGDMAARLRDQGCYLITGGLSGIGLVLAEYLVRTVRARLVLIGRSPLPLRADWDNWVAQHDENDAITQRIQAVRHLEELGGEVLAQSCDVTDRDRVQEVLARARQQFGEIHAVIHSAGVAGAGIIQNKDAVNIAQVLAPKVRGVRVLDELLSGVKLDFLVLCSSLSSVVGGLGQADYCAANAFLDAFARERTLRTGQPTLSINWDTWREVGMAVATEIPADLKESREEDLKHGLSNSEGVEAFCRILRSDLPQVLVSTRDLVEMLRRLAVPELMLQANLPSRPQQSVAHARPILPCDYVAPRNDVERVIAEIWEELLGIEPVGVEDNFFDLGGHSLLAIQLLSRVREMFQVELTLRRLFEGATVAQFTQNMLTQELTPGRIEKISQVMMAVEQMSASDVSSVLRQENALSANSAGN
jgi:NAD(P)-dependent dehydrogenase (short-subunit alcohol dehydrogenase family)/aryl carrier-like protein